MTHRAISLLAVLGGACADGIPDRPTYFEDVQPILVANCARCHGGDPVDVAVAWFRLDRHVEFDTATVDAFDLARGEPSLIEHVAVNRDRPAMPPDYPLTDRQREILARWIEQGAKKGSRSNRSPRAELLMPAGASTADQTLAATFAAWDADRDGLYVQLWARDTSDPDGQDLSLTPVLGAGRRELVLDTGTLPSARSFEIFAVLDDGHASDPAANQTVVTLVPQLAIDHGARGTAPRVELLAPDRGEAMIGSTTIKWTASDPDPGDVLMFALDLLRVEPDGTRTVVASIAANLALPGPAPGTPYAFVWEIPPDLPTSDATGRPIAYAVRVTARDTLGAPEPNERSDESTVPGTIAHPMPTAVTWNDVRPVFETHCQECHGATARTPAIDYLCLLKYDSTDVVPACEPADEGVADVKGLVYQRMIVARTMPPASEARPSQADLDLVASWLLGGAPRP